LVLQNFYGELSELLTWLEENEEEILTEDDLRFLTTTHGQVDHYAISIRFLRDYLGGVRSSYQAQLDLSMNKVMKIFTVISAVFLPLTLLVGWYGMNFKYMPELSWQHGYLTIGVLSFVFIGLILMYLKKKKLL
jgi:magnesium transporter